MRVVSILGGLGSQMFKYAFFLRLEELSGEKCYISTLPFLISKMHNGYELNKIFGIKAPDIVDNFSENELNLLIQEQKDYRICTLDLMAHLELNDKRYLVNRGNVHISVNNDTEFREKNLLRRLKNSFVVRFKKKLGVDVDSKDNEERKDHYPNDYFRIKGNVLYDEFDHSSDIYIKSPTIDFRNIFVFPEFIETVDIEIASLMQKSDSVMLHVRRSDHMYDNGALFERNYFRKAVGYMAMNLSNPLFFIFSDDMVWCRDNLPVLGLETYADKLYFIDWNYGTKSYRDMQLMTFCKNYILCISSFSWWGYYLSKHQDKLVCAPEGCWFEVEKHF